MESNKGWNIEYSDFLRKLRFNKTVIKNSNIFYLKKELNWEGKGTAKDPIIIDNIEGLDPNLVFKKLDLHIILRNLKVCLVYCEKTQNITIENCKIYELDIQGCYNLTIHSNKIVFFKLIYTRASVIEENELFSQSLARLHSGFSDKFAKFLSSNFLYLPIIFITVAILSTFWIGWAISVWFLVLTTFSFYLSYHFRRKQKYTEGMAENIVIKNQELKDYLEIEKQITAEFQGIRPRRVIQIVLIITSGSIGLLVVFLIPIFNL